MGDYYSTLKYFLYERNDILDGPAVALFMMFILLVAYTLFIFEVEKKFRKLGISSFVAYICSFYCFYAYCRAPELWEKGLYLPIPRPAMICLFLLLWAAGTLLLAAMISRMAKDRNKRDID